MNEALSRHAPGFRDVLRAQRVIRQFLRPTPLFEYPALSSLLGFAALVKHENHQPVGAFKVRGGVYLLSQLDDDERSAGIIAASTGNHGQSLAWAGRKFAVPVVIVVPEGANPGKVESMKQLGAAVISHGLDFDASREHAERLAIEHGYRYVSSGNEPLLIAGVATVALEMLEDDPEIDTLIVPIGGGTGAAGATIAAKSIDQSIRVIGVQAQSAPSVFKSWESRSRVETESSNTFAEGLATRAPFDFPLHILWQDLDEFVLVSEGEMREAIRILLEKTHNLAEGAGAAALAAAIKLGDSLRGHRVGIVLSGGNLSVEQLRSVLSEP
jgi:threonine dehydratase